MSFEDINVKKTIILFKDNKFTGVNFKVDDYGYIDGVILTNTEDKVGQTTLLNMIKASYLNVNVKEVRSIEDPTDELGWGMVNDDTYDGYICLLLEDKNIVSDCRISIGTDGRFNIENLGGDYDKMLRYIPKETIINISTYADSAMMEVSQEYLLLKGFEVLEKDRILIKV